MTSVKGKGKLATIVGLDKTIIEEKCAKANGLSGEVRIALENSEQQYVIGGKEEDVDIVVALLKEEKNKGIFELKVSNAFHTYLMEPMVDAFREFVNTIKFHETSAKILLNSKGGYSESIKEVKEDIIKQCVSTVKWSDCMKLLLTNENIDIAEIGVGRVLTNLMRSFSVEKKIYSLSNKRDFEQFRNIFGGVM